MLHQAVWLALLAYPGVFVITTSLRPDWSLRGVLLLPGVSSLGLGLIVAVVW